MPTRIAFSLLVLALVPAGAAPMQAVVAPEGCAFEVVAGEGPESIAAAFFHALAEARWDDATGLVDRETLAAFRSQVLEQARAHAAQPGPDTRWEPGDPDMPEAVREWFRERARRAAEEYGSPLAVAYGVESVEALEALAAEELFSRVLSASDPAAFMRRSVPAEERAVFDDPDVASFFRPRRHLVGSVLEGDGVAHVVFRECIGAGAGRPSRIGVLPLRLTPEGWRVGPLEPLMEAIGSGYLGTSMGWGLLEGRGTD